MEVLFEARTVLADEVTEMQSSTQRGTLGGLTTATFVRSFVAVAILNLEFGGRYGGSQWRGVPRVWAC